ncbi:ImmA/IrrE family metallo-endopeptidase [Lacibacterium aquatile]|uniref:ImmA/IrrE family metallo-endopeptidase n=1 Tax=Lacibacterium aquatile TaxID=1168082 RepID=A0ABW5DY01_9PROT
MDVAQVVEVESEILSPSFIDRMRASVGAAAETLKRAVGKVLGLFHASEGLIFIDRTLLAVKQRFIRLHECGHGFLPWQRPMYKLVEDCDKSLDPDTAELFDREANVFAAEVLFHLDLFRDMAESEEFSIWTPVRLAKKFDASIYASIRQYISKNHRACAVVVLDMPEFVPGEGLRANLRRKVQSASFTEMFGAYGWKQTYTSSDDIGAMIPVGKRRSSNKRALILTDKNGIQHECIAEAFTQTHQVFILVHAVKTLTRPHFISTGSLFGAI